MACRLIDKYQALGEKQCGAMSSFKSALRKRFQLDTRLDWINLLSKARGLAPSSFGAAERYREKLQDIKA